MLFQPFILHLIRQFIDSLQDLILRFMERRRSDEIDAEREAAGITGQQETEQFAAAYEATRSLKQQGAATLDEVSEFVKTSGVSEAVKRNTDNRGRQQGVECSRCRLLLSAYLQPSRPSSQTHSLASLPSLPSLLASY